MHDIVPSYIYNKVPTVTVLGWQPSYMIYNTSEVPIAIIIPY